MSKRAMVMVVFVLGAAVLGSAQVGLAVDAPRVGPSRFKRTRASSTVRRRPTTRSSRISSKQRNLFIQANELARKVHASGPWSQHAQVIEQAIEGMWGRGEWRTDTDLFVKQTMIDVSKHPPWDFTGRLKVATDKVQARYGLNDEQVKKLRARFIRHSFAFFMQNAEQLLPVARGIIETRLANKPFTPEQVAKWTKVIRPVMDKWYSGTKRQIREFAAKDLTPAQRAKVNEDLAIIDRRANAIYAKFQRWERGEWTPEMWGLENDPVHARLQAELAQAGGQRDRAGGPPAGASRSRTPAAGPSPLPQAGGTPPRIGQSPGGVRSGQPQASSPLPDENAWVTYVRTFCDRYGLDKAQRSAADAILKDMQEQAQTYRGSRSDDIKQLEAQIRQADSAELRREVQAELREVLRGIDELFEELKGRLENIPTADQLRRAG